MLIAFHAAVSLATRKEVDQQNHSRLQHVQADLYRYKSLDLVSKSRIKHAGGFQDAYRTLNSQLRASPELDLKIGGEALSRRSIGTCS